MSAETLIQSVIVRVDMALVAAWHILKFALPAAVIGIITAAWLRRLRHGR